MTNTQSLRSASQRDEVERNSSAPWRAWYKTYRWQKLREVILLRDNYTCQVTGVVLSGKHPEPNSAVIDHIQPHRGNEKLFWGPDNLQAVSKEYHDSPKQKEEQASLHMRGCWD